MTWRLHSDFPGISDREAGLYFWSSDGGRDNYDYCINRIEDGKPILCFRFKAAECWPLSESEKSDNPEFEIMTVYQVVDNIYGNKFNEKQRWIIESVLSVWTNNIDGYQFYRDGIGVKSLCTVEYVNHIEGH